MHRRKFLKTTALAAAASRLPLANALTGSRLRYAMDMVHFNPGEPAPQTRFLDMHYVRHTGFTAEVIQSPIEGVALFEALAPGAIPSNSVEGAWAAKITAELAERFRKAHEAGLTVYAWMQLVVLPRAIVERFRDEICDKDGRIDVERPRTQRLIAAQLTEILDRLPQLSGFVIRTGEVYLQDLPYHASSGNTNGRELIQESTAILHGERSHIALLKLLREIICVQRKKKIFYRTWDFGYFHTHPDYYLRVTDAIAPHDNLVFSIKHQAGDFHQLTPFNPTLTLGKHPQIVEVQCQREAYGKGAHPYYIGSGVLDGWEDMAWINPPDRAKGLRGIYKNPRFAGVWTWSRGGGWEGPYIKNELWCSLNTHVIAAWAQAPGRTERDIFIEAARGLGVAATQLDAFRELCMLSARAVLRGQLTAIPSRYDDPIRIDLWWARDDKLDAPDLTDFVRRNLVERSIAEKQEAVTMWRRIVELSQKVELGSQDDTAFMRSSCIYGLMKYRVIAAGWTALLLSQQASEQRAKDRDRIRAAIADWDESWSEWKAIAAKDPLMSTLVHPQAFDVHFQYRPGMAAAVDALRQ